MPSAGWASTAGTEVLSDREELLELTRALRAHVEWQAATGAFGLPVAEPGRREEPPPRVEPPPARQPAPRAEPVAREEPREPAEAPALGAEEVRARLTVLSQTVAGCSACRLHETRTQTVFARGNGSSGLCFVGEGPGADEDAQGIPFVGPAGQLLDRMIGAMGFERDDVYVANIVKCRPPKNRKPQPDEMDACRGYLEEQLELLRPSVIVALGATAVQGLLGTSEGITRLRGRWKLYKGIAVMPTFHPAYLLRTPSAKREVWNDLQAVLRQMGRPIPSSGK
ncbi:MAG: uracil-DNA glycosylase [Polyangiaceae bacterium]|nr:uracil-DNA glycosylase [Polyangiaceae bacterium]